MPLSVADAAVLNNSLTKSFEKIATVAMPAVAGSPVSNTEPVAWRLFVSQRLKSYAEAFNKTAVKDAVAAGVLFDHSKKPKPAGVDEVVYHGDVVQVDLKTKNGSRVVDMDAVMAAIPALFELSASEEKKLAALVAKHTKINNPPHTFTATLRT